MKSDLDLVDVGTYIPDMSLSFSEAAMDGIYLVTFKFVFLFNKAKN